MASANLPVALKKDWLPANPWLWLTVGFALTLWSWFWALAFGKIASDNRVFVLALGLLCAGAGVWLRCRDRETVYVRTGMPPLAILLRLGMGLLFAALALFVTGLLISTFFTSETGWKPGATSLVWLSVAPTSAFAALRCWKRESGQETLGVQEEVGLAILAAGGFALLGSYTLDLGPAMVEDWDSMRLFLRVAASFSAFAAALVLVSTRLRRLVLSLLIPLHFVAISNACLAAPPAPWIVQQTWTRLFRPYLEFMYLNNAYHFYAPEPGPYSYIWFRIIYTTEDGEHDHGKWLKFPDLDEQGRIGHPVALEYQRFLALSESVAANDQLPPEMVPDEKGMPIPNPFYMNRLHLAPGQEGPNLGQFGSQFRIPLHPTILRAQQVRIPNDASKRMLESFARHVAHEYPTLNVNGQILKFKQVKIYRVTHSIPPIMWHQTNIPPADPELYLTYYTGTYNAKGRLIEDQDPYRYWLLPALRVNPSDPDSEIRDYTRLHAGDPEWVRPRGEKKWVNPERPPPK